MGGGLGGSFGGTKGSNGSFKETLDHISNLLTAASFVPGLDTFTNIASIPVDALRGDWVSTILDIAGVIPVFGEAADFAKTGDKIIDGVKTADKARDSAKAVRKATTSVQNISPYKITKTHSLTLSKKKYAELVESIRKNGITEPIKYVEHNGTKYVVDGHHRLQAAKDLKLKDIPVEKVSLPYKGYKTVTDLEWFD